MCRRRGECHRRLRAGDQQECSLGVPIRIVFYRRSYINHLLEHRIFHAVQHL